MCIYIYVYAYYDIRWWLATFASCFGWIGSNPSHINQWWQEQLFQLAFALIPASGVLNDPLLAQVGPAEAVLPSSGSTGMPPESSGRPIRKTHWEDPGKSKNQQDQRLAIQNLDASHLSAKLNKTFPKICGLDLVSRCHCNSPSVPG